MDTVLIPERKTFFLGSLAEGFLEGMDHRALQLTEEEKDALLSGEPQDNSCVMGLRYSFSEFDIGHFCKSLFTLIGGGDKSAQKDDQGFKFYLD